jgi:hypothetical protein
VLGWEVKDFRETALTGVLGFGWSGLSNKNRKYNMIINYKIQIKIRIIKVMYALIWRNQLNILSHLMSYGVKCPIQLNVGLQTDTTVVVIINTYKYNEK